MNKKAILDEYFDLIFTLAAVFFLFFFLSFALKSGTANAEEASLKKVSNFNFISSAIANLRVQEAQDYGLDTDKINEQIANSKKLGGKTITNCRDYIVKEDCNQDIVGLTKNLPHTACIWKDSAEECLFHDFSTEQVGID